MMIKCYINTRYFTALCNAVELQEQQRQNIVSVIAALQNDSDRDVRRLLSHLSDITSSTSETHNTVCHVMLHVSMHQLFTV